MPVLVPIPSAQLEGTAAHWFPFIEAIAQRNRCSVGQLVSSVMSNEVHVILIWEPDEKKAVALVGTRIILRGDDRVAEIIWATGSGRKTWLPLLPELEAYHREHLNCVGISAIARPGWSRDLKSYGYRTTHLVMEKAL